MPYYDPCQMAGTVERMVRAFRRVPIRIPEIESEREYIARILAWRKEYAREIEDAYNPAWVDEIQRLLMEHEPYTK